MRQLGRRWLSLLCCAFASAAAAQIDAGSAEQLMRKAGMWQQLESIGPQVQRGLRDSVGRPGASPSAAETERVLRAGEAAFATARLQAAARAGVAARLEARDLPLLSRWFDSAAGRRRCSAAARPCRRCRRPGAPRCRSWRA